MLTYHVCCLFDASLSCNVTANNAYAALFIWVACKESILLVMYDDTVFSALLRLLEVSEV